MQQLCPLHPVYVCTIKLSNEHLQQSPWSVWTIFRVKKLNFARTKRQMWRSIRRINGCNCEKRFFSCKLYRLFIGWWLASRTPRIMPFFCSYAFELSVFILKQRNIYLSHCFAHEILHGFYLMMIPNYELERYRQIDHNLRSIDSRRTLQKKKKLIPYSSLLSVREWETRRTHSKSERKVRNWIQAAAELR